MKIVYDEDIQCQENQYSHDNVAAQEIKTVVQLIQVFLEKNLYSSKEQLMTSGFEEDDINAAIELNSSRAKELNIVETKSSELHLVLRIRGVQSDFLEKDEKEQDSVKINCANTLQSCSSEQSNNPLHFSRSLHLALRLRGSSSLMPDETYIEEKTFKSNGCTEAR